MYSDLINMKDRGVNIFVAKEIKSLDMSGNPIIGNAPDNTVLLLNPKYVKTFKNVDEAINAIASGLEKIHKAYVRQVENEEIIDAVNENNQDPQIKPGN